MINFELPNELIAQHPVSPRDSARLLVYSRKDQTIVDATFRDLNKFLPEHTTLVLNNSKVENCRWLFDSGRLEIFVISKSDVNTIRAMVRPGKKFKLDTRVQLTEDINAVVTAVDNDGIRTLRLNVPHDSDSLKKYEHVPLPPYIKQDDSLADEYQTVFAKPEGSKAAPTAGLHFTPELLENIKKSHKIAELTLHVGLGTFASLTESQLSEGKLHKEWFEIDTANTQEIKKAKHITAVGTTSVRTLESITDWSNSSFSGWTDILISPGFKFKKVNSLVTNFHLPGTSLLLLVEAMVGSEAELQRIYNHAITSRYRFYSFGDAMLII